jgi:hypothetical protein
LGSDPDGDVPRHDLQRCGRLDRRHARRRGGHVAIAGAQPHFGAADIGQAIAVDLLVAPFSVPIGIVIGLPIGVCAGLAIAVYARIARRRNWAHRIGGAFRLIIVAVVTVAALTVCAIALSTKSASIVNTPAAWVAVGLIPLATAIPLAMWGAGRLVRAVEQSTTIRRLPNRAGLSA